MRIVASKEMSAGNAHTGHAWTETKIFSDNDAISDVMKWVGSRTRRVTLTVPENDFEQFDILLKSKQCQKKNKTQ